MSGLTLRTISDDEILTETASAFLASHELECERIVTMALKIEKKQLDTPHAFWGAFDDKTLVALAGQTNGALSGSLFTPESAILLAHATVASPLGVSLFTAPRATAEAYTAALLKTGAVRLSHSLGLRLFRLDTVIPPPKPAGVACVATSADVDAVLAGYSAFSKEALNETMSAETARPRIQNMVERGAWTLWKVNDRVVSMAFRSRDTRRGTGISAVYTPPDERGKGYAAACVAHLSQALLDEGRTFCFLYTDETNATSNGVYQRIGYRFVEEYASFHFETIRSG